MRTATQDAGCFAVDDRRANPQRQHESIYDAGRRSSGVENGMSVRMFQRALLGAAAILAFGAPAQARDEIRIVGSSTVYPFTTAVAEQFAKKNPKFKAPIVESTGTGGGLQIFCSGLGDKFPDITNASRRIKKSEVDLCAKNGVGPIVEIQVGLDGIALAQAKAARAIALTRKDIFLALVDTLPNGKKNSAKVWKDVNPALPATRIEVMGPPPTSGTRDAFNELVMEAGCVAADAKMEALKKSDEKAYKARCTKLREDGTYIETGENDNLIVQKLVANPAALGIFGYSYLEENLDKIKDVNLDGVPATYANISSFKYPASRPLYIYVKARQASQPTQLGASIKAYLAEYAKESTWGPKGYLAKRGLVATPEAIRKQSAAAATRLIPLNPAAIK